MIRVWRLGSQRGTSTLEFIVVLPVLLIIFLAGLELSRAWFTATIATNAARDGARVAVAMDPVDPANPSFANAKAAGEQRIDDILTAANLTAVSRSVTCETDACPADSQVTASVKINFLTVTPGFLPMLGTSRNPLVLTETTIMRRE
jgi:Flp pilus assembly protein TadG